MKRLFLIITTLLLILLLTPTDSIAQEQCQACHGEITQRMTGGYHQGVSCATCHEGAAQHAGAPTQISPGIDVSAQTCGNCHQLQYDDYRYVGKVDQTEQKMVKWPLIPKLLSGHGFAKDYREPREHFQMLDDINLTSRKTFATCYFCKSADVYHQWNKPGGINFDSDAAELISTGRISNPITCVMCHDPHVTDIRVVTQPLLEALDRMDDDHPGKNDDIHTQTCAQCHVNYNFVVPEKSIEYPYVKVADMPNYINSVDYWNLHPTGGWIHPELDMYLYKVQHPEVELYWDSKHHQAGVTCVDCHMPKITSPDGRDFTQHFLGSPLNNPEQTCTGCHHTTSADDLRQMVVSTQDEVYSVMKVAMDEMSIAIDTIEAARTATAFSESLLEQAREAYFLSHLNWEWIAAENSMGFHHPEEALASLNIATEKAREARELAQRAIDEPDTMAETPDPGVVGGDVDQARNYWLWLLPLLAVAVVAYFVIRNRQAEPTKE